MRKPDPERIYQARRAANVRRLVLQHRIDELRARVDYIDATAR
jgi:hypothetical protein